MEEIYIHIRFLLLNTQKKHRMVSECSVFSLGDNTSTQISEREVQGILPQLT